MSEQEPSMKLDMGNGREFEATRYNTTLFTFLGRYACYDHIFVQTGEEDETQIGTYIFNQHEAYEPMSEYMWENDYPMHLNMTTVARSDIKAFNQMVHQEVESEGDYIPEDWK